MRNVLHARECGSTPSPPSWALPARPAALRSGRGAFARFGRVPLHDTDAVLAALPATLPVSVRYRTSYWVTIGPRIAAA